MRDNDLIEKMENILQNQVVSETDLRLFKFVLDKRLEKIAREIQENKTGEYEYKVDLQEARLKINLQ